MRAAKQINRGVSIFGKIFMTLFGLIFFSAGCFFSYMVLNETYERYITRQWAETPCLITQSSVAVVDEGYEFRVGYQYHWEGQTRFSNQFATGGGAVFDDVSEADAQVRILWPGYETVCFVDPDNPENAVLHHRSMAMGFTVLFTMIFVVIGAGIIYSAWSTSSTPRVRSLSLNDTKGDLKARLGLAGFFSIFFLAGAAFGYFAIFQPIYQSLTSGDWVETPCTVHSSRVQTHEDSDGDTYSVDIMYFYEFQGRQYRSDDYNFMGGSSSGYSGKAEIVRNYPAGSQQVCYVNPNNPTEAVLKTDLGAEIFLIFFPLIFMGVGLAGMLYALFHKDKKRTYKKRREKAYVSPGTSRGMQVLKPKSSALGKILGSLFAAIFWNGIVSVFLFQVYEGWSSGHGSIGLTLFLIPFVLIGIVIIFAFFHSVLGAFNPKFVFTLYSDHICLGDEVKLTWETKGNPKKFRRFTMTLKGQEEATYRRGTNTYTDTHTFHKTELVDLTEPGLMQRGEVRITIPRESMHSFKSSNNAITWNLRSHTDIPWWPDIKDDFALEINPLAEGEY